MRLPTVAPAPVPPAPPKPPSKSRARYARSPETCRVGEGWYPSRDPQRPGETVPRLRLRGRWLEELGFEVGARLRIIRSEGAITLQLIRE